ncbi:alpha/beta hydrolase [Kribbella albertanoniae]|uniref:Alpha/beta hydrolase n=1 Tax=Kribbella albertanoniae TaxID=1266829 RepID=A0A4R4QCN7_9ACTN|nr:alpha/beta hydrolase [Kribbella albertanoniae]TDC33174.1 alpha/beta hydrolase [Kribbella albertanoniae]
MATTTFDVGGYELAAEIAGEGSPTVVFVSGAGGGRDSWDAAIAVLRSSTTRLTYDRAGIGDSETPDLSPRTLGAAADELRGLLAAADLPGPLILVGHSLGGLIALIYASQWPVAGLVLVDTSDIHLNLDVDNPILTAADGNLTFAIPASVADVTRSRRPLDIPSIVIASRPGHWLEDDTIDFTRWHPFTPTELDNRWQAHQQSLAADLGATHKVARHGGHTIQSDDPTIVADSIDTLVDLAR